MKISFLKPLKIIKILNNSKSGQKKQKFCFKKVFVLLKYHKLLTFLVKKPKKKNHAFLGDFIWNHTHAKEQEVDNKNKPKTMLGMKITVNFDTSISTPVAVVTEEPKTSVLL